MPSLNPCVCSVDDHDLVDNAESTPGWLIFIRWCALCMQGMEQTSYVVDDFVREWKKVWEAVACLPNFSTDLKGRLLVDLANEPDSQWQGWQVKNGKAGEWRLDGEPTCSC